MPYGIPVAKTANISPFTGGVADGSINREIQGDWSRRDQDGWQLADYAKFESTANLTDTYSIPLRIGQFTQTSLNGKRTVETPSALSFQVQQRRYTITAALNRSLQLVDGLSDIKTALEVDMNSKANQHLRNLALSTLYANPTRAQLDGLAHFHASHPINPLNPNVTNPAGSATQPNLYTTTPLTHVNIIKGIQNILGWVDSSGQPVKARNFTLFATQSNLFGAAHWLSSAITGTNFTNGYVGSGNDVGASTNPMASINSVVSKTIGKKININLEVFEEYPGTATDWYLAPNIGPVWAVKLMLPHRFSQSNDPASYNAIASNNDLWLGDAMVGVSLADVWSIAKFTA